MYHINRFWTYIQLLILDVSENCTQMAEKAIGAVHPNPDEFWSELRHAFERLMPRNSTDSVPTSLVEYQAKKGRLRNIFENLWEFRLPGGEIAMMVSGRPLRETDNGTTIWELRRPDWLLIEVEVPTGWWEGFYPRMVGRDDMAEYAQLQHDLLSAAVQWNDIDESDDLFEMCSHPAQDLVGTMLMGNGILISTITNCYSESDIFRYTVENNRVKRTDDSPESQHDATNTEEPEHWGNHNAWLWCSKEMHRYRPLRQYYTPTKMERGKGLRFDIDIDSCPDSWLTRVINGEKVTRQRRVAIKVGDELVDLNANAILPFSETAQAEVYNWIKLMVEEGHTELVYVDDHPKLQDCTLTRMSSQLRDICGYTRLREYIAERAGHAPCWVCKNPTKGKKGQDIWMMYSHDWTGNGDPSKFKPVGYLEQSDKYGWWACWFDSTTMARMKFMSRYVAQVRIKLTPDVIRESGIRARCGDYIFVNNYLYLEVYNKWAHWAYRELSNQPMPPRPFSDEELRGVPVADHIVPYRAPDRQPRQGQHPSEEYISQVTS